MSTRPKPAFKRRRTIAKGASVLALATALIFAQGVAANAAERHGELTCAAPVKVYVNSGTTTGGAPAGSFAVGHYAGGYSTSWSTAGAHGWKSPVSAGNWQVSTNGTLSSASAYCQP